MDIDEGKKILVKSTETTLNTRYRRKISSLEKELPIHIPEVYRNLKGQSLLSSLQSHITFNQLHTKKQSIQSYEKRNTSDIK